MELKAHIEDGEDNISMFYIEVENGRYYFNFPAELFEQYALQNFYKSTIPTLTDGENPFIAEQGQKPCEPSKTYLLKDVSTGFYKIGKSKDPLRREKTLQAQKPTYNIVKVWDEDIERKLHNEYRNHRLRGEWFSLSKSQVKYICTKY